MRKDSAALDLPVLDPPGLDLRVFDLSKAAAIIAVAFICAQTPSSAQAQATPGARFATPWKKPATIRREAVRGAEEPAIGQRDAPVTIVNFSDYLCPYCRKLSGTLQSVLEERPGAIRIIYRHLALTDESQAIAHAALCADEQNRFAEYHQLLFATRGVDSKALEELAAQLPLDLDAFRECTTSNRHAARIAADVREADRLGIEVTPTLFINGERLIGAASLETLRTRLEQFLPDASQGRAVR